jgi:hypothetical protein
MLRDEQIAPLVDDLWGQAQDAFTDYQDQIGFSWEDMQQLPHGEICFAVIAPRRADAQFVLFFDVNPESESFDHVMGRVRELAENDGTPIEEEEVEDVVYSNFTGDGVKFTQFRMDNTIAVTSDRKLAEEIVTRWRGGEVEKVRTLAENRKFITIMNRCRGTKDVPPEMRFFVDPIELFRVLSRGEVGMQAAINFLPLLGLDGLLAVGGASIFDELEFESVAHMHILMANPRAGILEMLSFKPGDYRPESWVTENATTYLSARLDAPKMYSELTTIVNGFMGEDAMQNQISENINDQLDINFDEDVIGNLTGRLTMTQWVLEENYMNAQSNAFGIGIKDQEKTRELIGKILERIEQDNNNEEPRMLEEEYEKVVYWMANTRNAQERMQERRDQGDVRVNIRIPSPCFAIIEDTLLITDSEEFMKHCIDTYNGDAAPLAENFDFQTVAERSVKLLGNDMPCGVLFSQPRETFRWMFRMAQSDDTRNLLDEASINMEEEEAGKYIERFRQSLEDHPLPDFEVVEKYFMPSGGFMTTDETGYHFLVFNMRGEE